ncbi:hypothetical protein HPP92_016301 [Vanilla planifolia]|uniref:Protein kinase domain-containing protein n=1 Tax=Vanilla planifolia TaxID=51239 RepID=A0A835US06_VANPL|nr:hypothetical protein HPP92_016301 [Vanilla planifolia]
MFQENVVFIMLKLIIKHDSVGSGYKDIKCANILVHANGSVKLADFGLAKEITDLNLLKSCKGSVYWMALRLGFYVIVKSISVIHPKKTYGCPADIWSPVCTVLEMLTSKILFQMQSGNMLSTRSVTAFNLRYLLTYREMHGIHRTMRSGGSGVPADGPRASAAPFVRRATNVIHSEENESRTILLDVEERSSRNFGRRSCLSTPSSGFFGVGSRLHTEVCGSLGNGDYGRLGLA